MSADDQAAEVLAGHVGWVEFIHPQGATTHVAYIHEDGSIYLPEGDAVDPEWFALAAASSRFWPLVRKVDRDAQVRADAIARLTPDELIALGVEQGWLDDERAQIDTWTVHEFVEHRRYVTEWQPVEP